MVTAVGAGVAAVGLMGAMSSAVINGTDTAKADAKEAAIALYPVGLVVAGLGASAAGVGLVLWGLE